MHTPGHAVVNLVVLGAWFGADHGGAIVAGAVLPDTPIVVLYVRERWIRGRPEEEIWSVAYQRRFWQNLIHGAHSLPLAAAGAVAAWALGSTFAMAFFASLLLHSAADFPIHAIDAHRHFLPFSHWRFTSRLSYWDVRYHARVVALIEALAVAAASAFLWTRDVATAARAAATLVVVWYAWNYWRSFVHRKRPLSGSPV